jgi:hypothetical protein
MMEKGRRIRVKIFMEGFFLGSFVMLYKRFYIGKFFIEGFYSYYMLFFVFGEFGELEYWVMNFCC